MDVEAFDFIWPANVWVAFPCFLQLNYPNWTTFNGAIRTRILATGMPWRGSRQPLVVSASATLMTID